jgi:hypothetical protein
MGTFYLRLFVFCCLDHRIIADTMMSPFLPVPLSLYSLRLAIQTESFGLELCHRIGCVLWDQMHRAADRTELTGFVLLCQRSRDVDATTK